MSAMRRAALGLFALSLAACGGATRVVPRPVSATGEEDVAPIGEASIRVIPRESRGRTWMSLWIDAGSRDPAPPGVAAVAAWSVAHGSALEVHVIPDGTELRASCESERVELCVDALSVGLATRAVGEEALSAALERLRATRHGARRVLARTADRLAIEALLGGPRGWDAFGESGDDAAITRDAVNAFLAAHYGPARALFVVIGDADEERVRERIADAIARLPRASSVREERGVEPQIAARVEVDEQSLASVAVLADDAAHAIARRATAEIEGASASVFPVRGGEIVLVRARDADELVAAMSYARAVGGAAAELGEDDPRSMASRVGARWVARSAARVSGGMGIGAVVSGGRGDSDADDPDAAVRETERERLETRAASLEARARGEGIEADVGDELVTLRDEAGTRVIAQRAALGRVAIAIEIAGGTRDEPPRLQGRSALLARLLAGCVGEGAEPLVDARTLGVVVEVAPDRASEQIERATRCVRRRTWSPEAIEEARARALSSLDADARRLARAASAIAPGAPAILAPRGTAATLAAIERRSLRRAWRELAAQGRVSIAIVGEIEPERSARVAMMGLAALPASERRPAPPVATVSSEEIAAAIAEDEQLEVVLAVRDPAAHRASDVGARAVLDAYARALDGPALRVVWARAGSGDEGAWLALALRGAEEAIAALPARLDAARAQVRARLAEAVTSAAIAVTEHRAREGITARSIARSLLDEARSEPVDRDLSARTAAALLELSPRYVIARPLAAESPRSRSGAAR